LECAAKHAVQGFHDSPRSELIHEGSNARVVMVQMRKAQPVPPIFQPQVAAEAIVWAAYNNWREINAVSNDDCVASHRESGRS
jgi:hypothetical protein